MAMNKALKDSGFEFDSMEVPSEPEMTSVVIAPSASRSQPEIKRLLQQGARTASVSGWALDEGHKYAMRVDRAFPLSDHADYKELLGFITGVSPEIVYTIHGFDKEFAKDIQKNTGINAMHLKKHHASLASYY
jgi:Cft2 family RNA processing exonuclease